MFKERKFHYNYKKQKQKKRKEEATTIDKLRKMTPLNFKNHVNRIL